jgi:hypothetical protein
VDEVGLETIIEDEVVHFLLLVSAKVLARLANLNVVDLLHDVPQAIVEEGEQELRIEGEIVDLDLLDVDDVDCISTLAFEVLLLLCCFLVGVDVESTENRLG